jgi:hypothetical protein
MISKKRCQEIARDWVIEHAVDEYSRRLASIRKSDDEYAQFAREIGQPFRIDQEHRDRLLDGVTAAMLTGYYDPPTPKLPSLFRRLRLNDWTPPEPAPDEWPMGTAHRADQA